MRRGNRYYQEPQYVDPGIIQAPNIQMFNPEIGEMYGKALAGAQQRWDISQSAFAKTAEEAYSADINPRYREKIISNLEQQYENVRKNIADKYEGDYSRGVNEVIQGLTKSRGLLGQAIRATAEENKARELYQEQLRRGQAPTVFIAGEDGSPVRRIQSFEEYHKLNPEASIFDEKGQFIAPTFSALRGAGEHDKWTMENISKAIMQSGSEGLPETLRKEGFQNMWQAITTRGMSDRAIEEYFNNKIDNKGTTAGDMLTDTFLQNSTFAQEEFGGNKDLAKRFLKDLVKAQTSETVQRQFGNMSESQEYTPSPLNLFTTVDDMSIKTGEFKEVENELYDAAGNYKLFGYDIDTLTPDQLKKLDREKRLSKAIEGEFIATFGEMPKEKDLHDYSVKILRKVKERQSILDNFRKEYNLDKQNYSDRKVDEMYTQLENYINNSIGTLVNFGESRNYSKLRFANNFVNENDGNILVSQDIYLDGKRIDAKDKIKVIAEETGLNSEQVREQMKMFSRNSLIDFSGKSPVSLVGFLTTKGNKTIRIEIPTGKETEALGKDVHMLVKKLKESDTSPEILTNPIILPNGSTIRKVSVKAEFTDKGILPIVYLYDNKGNIIGNSSMQEVSSFLINDPNTGIKSKLLEKFYNY